MGKRWRNVDKRDGRDFLALTFLQLAWRSCFSLLFLVGGVSYPVIYANAMAARGENVAMADGTRSIDKIGVMWRYGIRELN